MSISQEQLDFLKKEFGLDLSDLQRMDINQWHEVRLKCFDIETEEAGLAMDSETLSDRGEIATSIVDDIFNKIMPDLKVL